MKIFLKDGPLDGQEAEGYTYRGRQFPLLNLGETNHLDQPITHVIYERTGSSHGGLTVYKYLKEAST